MRIGLIDVDSKAPNIALMKISMAHKLRNDAVEWYNPDLEYDHVYASKVFTFTPDYSGMPDGAILGGTGYGLSAILPNDVEHTCPDYFLYGFKSDRSYGFLTRGCPNNCGWCVVPRKEGNIRPNADISEFLRHDKCILMDNNILASVHGIKMIEKIARMKVKVDFNQGLDARLIDEGIAKRLAAVKWLQPLRLACDSPAMIEPVRKAVELLRKAKVTPARYNCYLLVNDVEEANDRAEFLRSINVDPFAQPFRDFENKIEPTQAQKDFARYVNRKQIWRSTKWENYKNG